MAEKQTFNDALCVARQALQTARQACDLVATIAEGEEVGSPLYSWSQQTFAELLDMDNAFARASRQDRREGWR